MSNTIQHDYQYKGLMYVSIAESIHFKKHCEIHPMTQLKLLIGAYDKGGTKARLQEMMEYSTAKYLKCLQSGMSKQEYQRQVLNQYIHK